MWLASSSGDEQHEKSDSSSSDLCFEDDECTEEQEEEVESEKYGSTRKCRHGMKQSGAMAVNFADALAIPLD